jgi:hypothetical protein
MQTKISSIAVLRRLTQTLRVSVLQVGVCITMYYMSLQTGG